jgi:hypothetical protein
MLKTTEFSKRQLSTPITTPIELYFSKWHIGFWFGLGIFFFIVGLTFAYISFFKIPTALFKSCLVLLFVSGLLAIGHLAGIKPGLRMARMKTPRIILLNDHVEYFDFDGQLISNIPWGLVRKLGYHWYDDGTIMSKFIIQLEYLNVKGNIVIQELDVKGLNADKDWIFQKINNHLNNPKF